MGATQTKGQQAASTTGPASPSVYDHPESSVETGGLHIIEFHGGTLAGTLTIIGFVLITAALCNLCWRGCRRRWMAQANARREFIPMRHSTFHVPPVSTTRPLSPIGRPPSRDTFQHPDGPSAEYIASCLNSFRAYEK